MPKLKSHKALQKKIKITGTGKVKFKRVGSSHLNSHLSGKKTRQLRQHHTVKAGDIKRLERMLHRPLKRGDLDEPR